MTGGACLTPDGGVAIGRGVVAVQDSVRWSIWLNVAGAHTAIPVMATRNSRVAAVLVPLLRGRSVLQAAQRIVRRLRWGGVAVRHRRRVTTALATAGATVARAVSKWRLVAMRAAIMGCGRSLNPVTVGVLIGRERVGSAVVVKRIPFRPGGETMIGLDLPIRSHLLRCTRRARPERHSSPGILWRNWGRGGRLFIVIVRCARRVTADSLPASLMRQ